jgi:two-component system chemotaxis response regulator CheB
MKSEVPKVRVLIVDDSALARRAIRDALSGDAEIEVVGDARDAYVARDLILALQPDVITLDLEMPRMDGLTFLKILQEHHPVPVVVVSSLTPAGSAKAMEALKAGALDVIGKPGGGRSLGEIARELAFHVKAVGRSRRDAFHHGASSSSAPPPVGSRRCVTCCRVCPTVFLRSWWCNTSRRIFPASWPSTSTPCAPSRCARRKTVTS